MAVSGDSRVIKKKMMRDLWFRVVTFINRVRSPDIIYATRKSSGLDEAVGVLKVGKHHLEMSAFRFERLPYRRQVEHTI